MTLTVLMAPSFSFTINKERFVFKFPFCPPSPFSFPFSSGFRPLTLLPLLALSPTPLPPLLLLLATTLYFSLLFLLFPFLSCPCPSSLAPFSIPSSLPSTFFHLYSFYLMHVRHRDTLTLNSIDIRILMYSTYMQLLHSLTNVQTSAIHTLTKP